jgi:8-oxo-dGTP pyrophosphatase MutT (NUDIX family)
MTRNAFVQDLEHFLKLKLPGRDAQFRMAPDFRQEDSLITHAENKAKAAAVLMLLYPVQGLLHTVFIQRPRYNGVHSGQISFPGGRKEVFDRDHLDAALREAREEIGIEKEKVHILGNLSPLYIAPSNFLVQVFVGFYPNRPLFRLQSEEVVGILEVSLELLGKKEIIKKMPMCLANGRVAQTPYYDIGGAIVWGATAMMISEFLEICARNKAGSNT